jgi:hypothetical protein
MAVKKKKPVITVCSSAQFFKQAVEVGQELKKLGFKVKLPKTASLMKRTGNFNVRAHKTWFKNKRDYRIKTGLIRDHFRKVIEADAILVLNLEKNGVFGYIGGNTLMEMALAFHLRKPIFIYNEIDDSLNFKEEVYGLEPVFIKGDLKLINKKLR